MTAARLPNFSNLLDDLSTTSQITTTDGQTLDGQVVLEENSNFQPNKAEIDDYAENVLGIDLAEESHLLYLAEEGIVAPLPEGWKPVQSDEGQLYYFNFSTGESMWDHPCDDYYKKQVDIARKKIGVKGSKKGVPGVKSTKRPLMKRDSMEAVTSSMESLSPIRRFRNYGNVSEDSERDFIRNMKLRTSQEFEEQNKIEPPPVKKPLIRGGKKTDIDPLHEEEDDSLHLDSDTLPRIPESKTIKPLLKDPSSSTLVKRASKTVTFHDENPLGNLISESSMDELSSHHVSNQTGSATIDIQPTISEKSPVSSISATKSDGHPPPEMTESLERHVKTQMEDIEHALEAAKMEYERDKAKRISDLIDRLQIAEKKETQLLKNRTAEVNGRISDIESELSEARRRHTMDKQAQLDRQLVEFKTDISDRLSETTKRLEKNHLEETERLSRRFRMKTEDEERELKNRYESEVAGFRSKYENLSKEEEVRMKRDYSEQLERLKKDSSQEAQLLAEQKDEMEQNLSKQMQRLEAQNQRSIDQLTEQHTADRQRTIADLRRQHETATAQLERDFQSEQESKRSHLKRQQELYLDRLRTEISTENYELETKKQTIENCKKRLELEEQEFEDKKAGFEKKMRDLEEGFADKEKKQQREIQDKLVDLMNDKDHYEAANARQESRKEALERDIERLLLERKELDLAVKKTQDDLLQTRHDLDLQQMKLETQKIRESQPAPINAVEQSSVSGDQLHDSGTSSDEIQKEDLRIELKGLHTTGSTDKTGLGWSSSGELLGNVNGAQFGVMQQRINELEKQMSQFGASSFTNVSSAKPPSGVKINQSDSRFMSNPSAPHFSSPYDAVDNEMASRRHQLEQYLVTQNDWWVNTQPSATFGRPVSREFEDLSAKELIRKRVELLQPPNRNSVGSNEVRTRHDSYQSNRSGGHILSGYSSVGVGAGAPPAAFHTAHLANFVSNSTPVKPVKPILRDFSQGSIPSSPPV